MTRSPRRRIRVDDEAAIERMAQAMDPGGMELEWKRDLAHRAFAALTHSGEIRALPRPDRPRNDEC